MREKIGSLASLLICAVATCAQTVCPPPPAIQPILPSRNIFTDPQESDLGDAMAESSRREFHVVDDSALSAHLRDVAGQLLPYLPPNHFRFHFSLMDIPEMNAFSLAGGRVFVSRKLVAFARSDDELAGVLAHEIGHIVTHQSAIQMTRRLRDVLGVTQVGDRADIFDKYQRLLESWRRKPGAQGKEKEEEDQYVADQVALYVMVRAGYNPQSFIDFWDRFSQLHGKTGNWLSDFFGTTKPEQKRLREMLKSLSAMPPVCSSTPAVNRAGDFQKWQADVVAYRTTAAPEESLPGVVFRQTLALPLRPDISNLRFSPDGKLVLAQDDGGIHVLKRGPLSLLFFIEAPDANKAFFSPDSRSVILYTPSLRVEVWDVSEQKRISVHEIVLRAPCLQDLLSPDGRILACLDRNFTFSLINVSTGEPLITKKDYFHPDFGFLLATLGMLLSEDETPTQRFSIVNMAFSPDGHYLLCGEGSNGNLGYDLIALREMSLPGSLKEAIHGHFAFVGNNRLAATNQSDPRKSPIYSFPLGQRIAEYRGSRWTDLGSVTLGNYVMASPLKDAPIGVVNLDTNTLSTMSHPAVDIYDGVVLYERDNGQVSLGDLKTMKVKASFLLVQSRLGALRTVAVSPDFNWLALSTRTRGGLWDLQHNIRVQLMHEFTGSGFDSNDSLIADFPKFEKRERSLAQIDVWGKGHVLREIKQELSYQSGLLFVERTPASDKSAERKNWDVDVRDVISNARIWSRHFPKEVPRMALDAANGTALLDWPVENSAARDELRQFSELKSKAENDDHLLEFVDLHTNALLGKLLVKTNKGSVHMKDSVAAGNWAAMEVRGDRVLTYSFRSGTEVGHVFGTAPLISAVSDQLVVTVANDEIQTYDLATTTLDRHYKFPTAVAFKQFSADGKRLFVLTGDQTVYILDLTTLQ
jgi:WD40 repeat protein